MINDSRCVCNMTPLKYFSDEVQIFCDAMKSAFYEHSSQIEYCHDLIYDVP